MRLSWLALASVPVAVYAQNSTTSGSGTPTTFATIATSNTASSTSSAPTKAPTLLTNSQVNSQILVIARDAYSATSAYSGLNGYGIPYQVLLVPQSGTALPPLNSSTGGNFGGIIIAGQVSYDYGAAGYQSALTQDQWNQLYSYQVTYGVRMVQYDVYPGPLFGATALGGCCGTGVEQLFSFTNTTAFAQAGIKTGAGVSTQGLYHYPAQITDANTTEIAQFAANSQFPNPSTAAVINKWNGRQQMVFFVGCATEWSSTSNFVQHAYITWMTRGLYAGYRRVNFNTQIDDMFLETGIYSPNGTNYRVNNQDMSAVANWVPVINGKMSAGSYYRPEIGHNGNGNIEYASDNTSGGDDACKPGAIETGDHADTPLEFKKTLGSGDNAWPITPTTYPYTTGCVNRDPLRLWFGLPGNRDQFMHISHTFSHYELNNATYSDALKEIQFNQAWMQQIGISAGNFTSNGLIPPAITGLHNGDVLRAWRDAGLTNCVGDNTRPVLRNTQNQMYAYTTTFANDGFDGFQVVPRWATRIYYNCDTADCTTKEWIDTSAGKGGFTDLMASEVQDTMRHLFGLYHDGYMFHQANLRSTGLNSIPVNGQNQQISIFQAWVETMVAEFTRLVNWPLITLKQSDLAIAFANRQIRDSCNYGMYYQTANGKITGLGVTANGNSCPASIPLTVPNGAILNTKGFPVERVGNDPTTIWVKLSGAQQIFPLAVPISIN